MNFSSFILTLILPLVLSVSNVTGYEELVGNKIISTAFEDEEILKNILDSLSNDQESTIAELIIKTGFLFKDVPYVDHTLEKVPEQLVINLREFDCTTFAENCLAIAQTLKNDNTTFEEFEKYLQYIRYRNGIIDGYSSRLHYFSEWIQDNQKKNNVEDISEKIGGTPYEKEINFMSAHPDSYMQLQNNEELIKIIKEQEEKLSSEMLYFIPEDKINLIEDQLQDGDIVGITTNIDGLDIMHVGILIRIGKRIHLLHASSSANKVIVSENTLEDYLKNSTSATGVMVARPKEIN